MPHHADFVVRMAVGAVLVYDDAAARLKELGVGPAMFEDWPEAAYLIGRRLAGHPPFDTPESVEVGSRPDTMPDGTPADCLLLAVGMPQDVDEGVWYVEAAVRMLASRWLPSWLEWAKAMMEDGPTRGGWTADAAAREVARIADLIVRKPT